MQKLVDEHLTLRLIRLKRSQAWLNQGEGFSFILAQGGQGQFLSGPNTQNLGPGDVLVLKCADGGKIAAASDELIFWNFSVCFEHLYPLYAISEISLLQNTAESLKSAKLYPAAGPLAQECHQLVASAPPQGSVDHRIQVLRVATAVLSSEFKNTRSQRAGFVRIEDHIIQVFDELSSTELLTMSVGDLAHKFSCSRRHLNRLFHQHFGCSVASLRMEIRLLKALSLLRNQNVKIIHVAEQCGFNHLGLFNACFKKRFGNTPGQWRKGSSNGQYPVSALDSGHPSCPMQAEGKCPWSPKPAEGDAMGRKKDYVQEPTYAVRHPNAKLREGIMRNIRKVNAQLTSQPNFASPSQNRP